VRLTTGGAERLIVDSASSLVDAGHSVHLFTNYHDPKHCYDETRDGRLGVTVYVHTRDALFGRFKALVAIVRMALLALIFAWRHARDFDVVVIDQVAHAVPLVRLFTECRVLFYCHFPDQLLSSHVTCMQRLYRWPLDVSEQLSTASAHRVLVNSQFTLDVFKRTFNLVPTRLVASVRVLYPSIDLRGYAHLDRAAMDRLNSADRAQVDPLDNLVRDQPHVRLLTSINRFERKKNVALCVRAFHLLHVNTWKAIVAQSSRDAAAVGAAAAAAAAAGSGSGIDKKGRRRSGSSTSAVSSPSASSSSSSSSPSLVSALAASQSSSPSLPADISVRLMLCGGYDPANVENVQHYDELKRLCVQLGLRVVEMRNDGAKDGAVQVLTNPDEDRDADGVRVRVQRDIGLSSTQIRAVDNPTVYFLRSFTALQRAWLLSNATAVLYTPHNEHFGIVPVEAMYGRRPVVAARSGGPVETIVDWLDDATRTSATGLLARDQTPAAWAQAIAALLAGGSDLARALGERGRQRVLDTFHFAQFQRQLIQHLFAMLQ
jgi:glycosyltransferase involved in cell wall biosynthesis